MNAQAKQKFFWKLERKLFYELMLLFGVYEEEEKKNMSGNMYWVTTLVFAVVLFLVWIDEKSGLEKKTKGDHAFSVMLGYGIFFCLQDMFWGLCDSKIIKGDGALFFASSFFHLAIVLTSYYCMKFFLSYLEKEVRHKEIFLTISVIVVAAQIFLVGFNCFYPALFRIEGGEYVTKPLRSLSFVNQYIVYIISGIMIFLCAKRADKKKKEKYHAILWVAVVPLFTGFFQLHYPDAPFYSLGYFLECMIVHMFIISRERNELYRERILDAIANSYYSMHLFDLAEKRMEEYIEPDLVSGMIENRKDVQGSLNRVMNLSAEEEYLENVKEFVDLSTLSERLRVNNSISMDFVGKVNGWVRATFISVEKEENGNQRKVMFMTQSIDEQKKKEQEMFAKSYTDPLTKLYNRRAYENDISQIGELSENMVYISIDVNELKVVNDNIGHEAGDEILIGAAQCMKRCFGSYGKVYRTGGDEFVVILYAAEKKLFDIKKDFEENISAWSGRKVDHVSVSSGYVLGKECSEWPIEKIANLADKRMYQDKAEFYRTKGVDRRGQAAAHTALCSLYTKILKVNLTEDTYSIVNMDATEQTAEKGFTNTISGWLLGFGKSGQVHSEDLDNYLAKTDIHYLKEYFRNGKTSITIFYRRKYVDGFKHVSMEMIPANDYSAEKQTLFLYVKNVDM